MKKWFFVFVVMASFTLASCAKDVVLTQNDVPSAISSYVTTHFPSNKILQTIKDQEGLSKSYEVVLDGNIKLEFNRKYAVTSVESFSKLPDSVIPAKILSYVKSNYPSQFIKKWELDDNRQKVELDNDLDLEFNKAGDFVKID